MVERTGEYILEVVKELGAKLAEENSTVKDYQREKVRIYRMLYEILAGLKKTFTKYGYKEERVYGRLKSYLHAVVERKVASSDLEKEAADEVLMTIEGEEDELLAKLKEVRVELSKKKETKFTQICPYQVLKRIALEQPVTEKEFKAVKGIGDVRFENCGEEFLEVIRNYNPDQAKKAEQEANNKITPDNINAEKLYNVLRTWRNKLAAKNDFPPYLIAANKTLKKIANEKPTCESELLNIKGIGEEKCTKYGKKILQIIENPGIVKEEKVGRISKPRLNTLTINKLDSNKNYTAVGLETTGTSRWDKIIELGAVKVRENSGQLTITDEFSKLVNAQRNISQEKTEITGISNQMITEKPTIQEVFPQFYEFVDREDILVYHGAYDFEIRFLDQALYRLGEEADKFNYRKKVKAQVNTKKIAADKLDLYSYSLDNVADHFGFELDYHRALRDAEVTAGILGRLLVKIRK